MTDEAITTLAGRVGVRAACAAAGGTPAGYYRRHRDRVQPRALSNTEREAILEVLHSDRFADLAPAQVWAILLDEGVYLGSQSTFYRLLRGAGQTRERRRQATHPAAVKPELLATAANEVWSWDITKLHGPAKWTYYYLYVILDIYSRYVLGQDPPGRPFRKPIHRPRSRKTDARAWSGVPHRCSRKIRWTPLVRNNDSYDRVSTGIIPTTVGVALPH